MTFPDLFVLSWFIHFGNSFPGNVDGPILPLRKDNEIRSTIQSENNLKPIPELIILDFEEKQYCLDDQEFDFIFCNERKYACKSFISFRLFQSLRKNSIRLSFAQCYES